MFVLFCFVWFVVFVCSLFFSFFSFFWFLLEFCLIVQSSGGVLVKRRFGPCRSYQIVVVLVALRLTIVALLERSC